MTESAPIENFQFFLKLPPLQFCTQFQFAIQQNPQSELNCWCEQGLFSVQEIIFGQKDWQKQWYKSFSNK